MLSVKGERAQKNKAEPQEKKLHLNIVAMPPLLTTHSFLLFIAIWPQSSPTHIRLQQILCQGHHSLGTGESLFLMKFYPLNLPQMYHFFSITLPL